MNSIAVIADIHGNMPALTAVVEDIERKGVDEVLVAGDLVGRGPQGSAVCARIQELGWKSIRGNHEDYLLSFRRREVPSHWWEEEQWACAAWMAEELRDSDIEYIDSLPLTCTSKALAEVRLFHGSPQSYREGIGAWNSSVELEGHASRVDEQLLVVAHTHRPFLWGGKNGRIVNVGSVGLPFNGDARAQYAIFRQAGARIEVDFQQVAYDREELLSVYQASGFLGEGGVTATLLSYEIRDARPWLMPFLTWAREMDEEPVSASLPRFIEVYDPTESRAALVARLRREKEDR